MMMSKGSLGEPYFPFQIMRNLYGYIDRTIKSIMSKWRVKSNEIFIDNRYFMNSQTTLH